MSGSKDKSLADDLNVPRLRDGTPPAVTYKHAEGNAARRMRDQARRQQEEHGGQGKTDSDQPLEGNLALDNTMCGSRPYDQDWPLTCEKILESILPAGSRLDVWITCDGGLTWWHSVFIGTGDRIIW
jgi:hypothetical protein